IPEVSLVAVLDADKEGFLRSSRSLIQTSGRAARHLNGRVIFYANHITRSMALAMNETERRRNVQLTFNATHGITPEGIKKRIKDIIDVGQGSERKLPTNNTGYVALSEEKSAKEIKRLEKAMYKAAQDMEFEQAAIFRDQLKSLKAHLFGGG
ncbi:MAG: UvrB/UvrC motif-containing protein, partial [Methylophilaceae bacterium]|nr:UvrB/UvrC motif-containing protein [Methylophilaceae bacterium]